MSFEDTLRMVNGKADDRTLPEPYLELDTHENQAILVTESLLKARAATWLRQLVTSALQLHLVLGIMRTRVLHKAGKAVRLPNAALSLQGVLLLDLNVSIDQPKARHPCTIAAALDLNQP